MIKRLYKSYQEYKELGLSSKIGHQGKRLINKDGSFNIRKKGLSFFEKFSFYNYLISIPWWKFYLWVAAAFFAMNFIFGMLYFLSGVEDMSGQITDKPIDFFWECFFFSTQTFTSVGYGRVNPIGFWANMIASIESLFGLLGFALVTGLLYGRFARPIPKLIFSKNIIISPYQDGKGLMFRFAHKKENLLTEVELKLILSWIEQNEEGNEPTRRFYELPLERSRINFLPLSWTVVHSINAESPLYQVDCTGLKEMDAEFMILVTGFDDIFTQTIHHRTSYKYNDLIDGAKFKNIFQLEDGKTIIDLDQISEIERIPSL